MLALTLGAGRRNPRGRTVDLPEPGALAGLFGKAATEGWWSTHTWEDGHRTADRWIGSAGVMVDVDYHDGAGHHVEPPEATAHALEAAARAGKVPGTHFHLTPRGARVVFLFPDQITDRELFAAAAAGAGALVTAALEHLGLHRRDNTPGYEVDSRVLRDLARFVYSPNAKVDGKARAAAVLDLNSQPWLPELLAAAVVDDPAPTRPEPTPQPTQRAAAFEEAVAAYNRDHAREFPRHTADCPACGHKDCFGRLPDDPTRWHCFAAGHTAPGIVGALGYHGDALDLDAHAAGASRRDLLIRAGYWRTPEKPAPVAPAPEPLAEVVPLRSFGKTFASLCAILRQEQRIIPEPLEWNEMLCNPTIGGVAVEDTTIAELRERIELTVKDSKGKGLKFAGADIEQALAYVAAERRYHPVAEYLQRLVWDGVSRIDHVADEILGAEDSRLNRAILRKWFISAAARPLEPGCKVDTVLILFGDQGAGKSTFFAELAGQEWFSDSAMDLTNKDAYLLLRRVWILEWSELESMQRARDAGAVKAFISTRVDTFRPPYGKRYIDAKRHCVIVGTTNDEEILADPTGNRRYWIVQVGPRLDLEKLRQWRDQLWAEAVAAFRAGEPWWLDAEEAALLAQAQARYERRDPWDAAVLDFVEGRGLLAPVTTADVLEKAIAKPAGQWTSGDQRRVASILKRAGYDLDRVRGDDGRRFRAWVRRAL